MSVNLAVVRGICSSPAEARELPSGSTLVLLQVTTRHGEEAAISTPWPRPAPAAACNPRSGARPRRSRRCSSDATARRSVRRRSADNARAGAFDAPRGHDT